MMDNNEWRYVKYKPGVAHLWEMVYKKVTAHGYAGYDVCGSSYKSKCRIISRLNFDETTILLANDSHIKKCKRCFVYSDGQISEQPRCRAHGDVAPVYAPPRFTPPISEFNTIPGNVWDGEGP